MMKVPQRIRCLREGKSLSQRELADRLGMDLQNYRDVETYEDEWDFVLTIEEFSQLAHTLSTSPLYLATGDHKMETPCESLATLAERIQSWICEGNSREELSWCIDDILLNPESIEKKPIIFLRDIADDLGLDWRIYLKDGEAQPAVSDNAV